MENKQTFILYSPGANGKPYFNQCGSTTETMEIQTKKLDISHSTSTLLIKIQTTVDEIWPNEGYPIRNLQVFYSKCYKTCQTCNGETFNNCLTCFTIAGPISGTCNNCMNEINKRFLLNTQGCIQECPTGYIYNQNSEFICQQNLKLINHLQLNYIQPMTTQDLILTSTLVITRTIITCSGTLAFFPYYQNELLYKSLSFSTADNTSFLRFWYPQSYGKIDQLWKKENNKGLKTQHLYNLIIQILYFFIETQYPQN